MLVKSSHQISSNDDDADLGIHFEIVADGGESRKLAP
jgi:hypothetical protein